MNIGCEDFLDIFWGLLQNWTIYRGHFYAFKGLFLKSMYRMGGGRYYFGLLKFQMFLGVLEIPDIFGVNGRGWTRAYL